MQAARISMRVHKIYCWNMYLKSAPFSEDAYFWYSQYLVFATNYDYM